MKLGLPTSNGGAGAGMMIVIVLSYFLDAMLVQLGAGNIPIPKEYIWTVPLLTALIRGLMAVLTPYYQGIRGKADDRTGP